MSKKISVFWVAVIVLAAILMTFMTTFLICDQMNYSNRFSNTVTETTGDKQYSSPYNYELLNEVRGIFEKNYIGELDEETIADMIVTGYVVGTGDKFASYMTAQELAEYNASYSGNLVGIGVRVAQETDSELLYVIDVVPNSPAEEKGICSGDIIIKVGDKVIGTDLTYNTAVQEIRGEVGTQVNITVRRGTQTLEFTLDRREVTSVSVTHEIYEYSGTKTAYINISSFDYTTPVQFKEAIDAVEAAGVDKIIYDLRNNYGGLLSSVLTTLTYVFENDVKLIEEVDNNGNVEVVNSGSYYSDKLGDDAEPLLVIDDSTGIVTYNKAYCDHTVKCKSTILVNSQTASAAELFTAVFRDYEAATIVGENTYGKGCMQRIFVLSNGGAVKITYKLYNPPCGINFDKMTEGPDGITPDITASLTESTKGMSLYRIPHADDAQFTAAFNFLYEGTGIQMPVPEDK